MNNKDIISIYKIPVRFDRSPYDFCNFDGKNLNLKGLTAKEITHELCHYIVAPKEARKIPDFGLGGGPETPDDVYDYLIRTGSFDKRYISNRKRNYLEEDLVVTLEGLFYYLNSLNKIEFVINNRKYLKILQKLKILNKNFAPYKIIKHLTDKQNLRLNKLKESL